jgi:hypothetical protein
MTRQEHMEHDLRMVVGDLMVQLVATRAELNELKELHASATATMDVDTPASKPNGRAKGPQPDVPAAG